MRLCLPMAGGERREPLTLPPSSSGDQKGPGKGERILYLPTPTLFRHSHVTPHSMMGTPHHAFQSHSNHT